MDISPIDNTLAAMTPDELGNALWYVDVYERAGMNPAECDEWRRRIVYWRRFVALDGEYDVVC